MKMSFKIGFSLLSLLSLICACSKDGSQTIKENNVVVPSIQWQKCYGGSDAEYFSYIQPTTDGGYITCGKTSSSDGDVSGFGGIEDGWVVKIDSLGNIQWQKCIGGTNSDGTFAIQQTSDGGYITCGDAFSNDGNISGNHGSEDGLVVKLTSTGSIQWQKCFGGTEGDGFWSIQQTSDGGFIVGGWAESANGDVFGHHGFDDAWVVKISVLGMIQWQKCLGGSEYDAIRKIKQTVDGGFIIIANTNSIDGDVIGNHGAKDGWVIKLNGSGNVQWKRCLGGTNDDSMENIMQTNDGGYVISGYTFSNDGDVSGNHGSADGWVVKLDPIGNILWQNCLGGSGFDGFLSIQQTFNGEYIVAGFAGADGGTVSGSHGQKDGWLVSLNSQGALLWQKCIGGSQRENFNSVIQTNNGHFILSGTTDSYDGDVIGSMGFGDSWIIHL
jgi:hypothetical protein